MEEEALRKVNTIVFDVDGVLTDGKYYVDELGNVRKAFLDKDFMSIQQLKKHFRIVFLTSSKRVNHHVAEMLGIQYVLEPHDKKKKLKELLRKWNVSPNNVIFIGDSNLDVKCTHIIPLSFCPADAVPELKNNSGVITLKAKGGEGVAIEIYEMLKPEIMRRRKYE